MSNKTTFESRDFSKNEGHHHLNLSIYSENGLASQWVAPYSSGFC